MKKKKKMVKSLDQYALGGETVASGMTAGTGGSLPWGTMIGGALQIIDALANPAGAYSDQPLMTIKQTSMATSPYSKGFKFANGGMTGQSNVEVEGGEVAETPSGKMLEFQGPDHEDGGIDTNLPNGTKIYSDRLKVDGKTMQERKKKREKTLAKIEKLMNRNPSDRFSKNGYERMSENLQLEDDRDMQLQEVAQQIYEQPRLDKYAYGGIPIKEENKGKFTASAKAAGMGVQEFASHVLADKEDYSPTQVKRANFARNAPKWKHAMGGEVNKYATGGVVYNPMTGNFEQVDDTSYTQIPYSPEFTGDLNRLDSVQPGLTVNTAKPVAEAIPMAQNPAPSPYNPEDYTDNTNTIGNLIGMAGSAVGAIAPLINTRNNAAATKPNRNFYKNFGKEALETNTQAQGYIDRQRTNALTDLSTQRNAARLNARNSARNIQTIRALDIATDMGTSKSSNDIYNTFANQMMQLLGQRSGLENQRDQMVMRGEQMADTANRQDIDAYYSNMGKDLESLAGGIQNFGKQMNQVQQNNDMLGFVNDQGVYVQYKRNRKTGRYEQVPVQ